MDGTERDEIHAVRELVEHAGGDLQAEPRFAGAARPGQRQQAGPIQELPGFAHLIIPPDKARQLRRQVVRRRLQRLERREIRREPLDRELKKAFRSSHVLEAMHPQIFECQLGWQRVIDQHAGGLGDQHLPAVPGARHSSGAMHVQPDIFVADQRCLAGVQSDADAHRAPVGPFVRLQTFLYGGRSGARLQRATEHDEERIALGPKFVAAIGGERLPLDCVMGEKDVRVSLAEMLDQPRRYLDIAEEEGDRAGR